MRTPAGTSYQGFATNYRDWQGARLVCRGQAMHLAAIETLEELNKLKEQVATWPVSLCMQRGTRFGRGQGEEGGRTGRQAATSSCHIYGVKSSASLFKYGTLFLVWTCALLGSLMQGYSWWVGLYSRALAPKSTDYYWINGPAPNTTALAPGLSGGWSWPTAASSKCWALVVKDDGSVTLRGRPCSTSLPFLCEKPSECRNELLRRGPHFTLPYLASQAMSHAAPCHDSWHGASCCVMMI